MPLNDKLSGKTSRMIKLEVVQAAESHPTRPEVIFTSVSQLTRWAMGAGVWRSPVRVRVNLSGLSQQEQAHWQERIEHLHNDCGCSAGAVSLFGLILAAIVYGAVIGFEQPLWQVALGTLIAAIAALLAGKLFGLAWSRRTLQRQVTQIVHLVERKVTDE